MKTTPEDLIIGFPVIQKLNLRIGSENMMAEVNSKQLKIAYCDRTELLLASSHLMKIEPNQSACVKIDKKLKCDSLVMDCATGEHIEHSPINNTIQLTNNTLHQLELYPRMLVAFVDHLGEPEIRDTLEDVSIIGPDVPKKDAEKYYQLVRSYSELLSKNPGKYCGETKMSVELTTTTTFKSRIIQIPFAAREHYKNWLRNMTELGVIEKSQSQYTSTLLVVKKKEEGQFRYVLNCSSINAITKIDYWPIPKLHDIMRKMAEHTLYAVCDVSKYFDSLPLEDNCKKFFSFICPLTQEVYSFTTVVQGSRNASFHSQMILRNEVLNGIAGCISYIDDIILMAETHEELFDILKMVLYRFKAYNLHLQPQKIRIGLTKVDIFGFTISKDNIKAENARLDAISNLPYPKNKRDLFKYMGTLNYYRIVTPGYTKTATELNKMLSMNVKFQQTEIIKKAFDDLKNQVRNSISLALPHDDGTMILNTDASEDNFGATLASRNNNDDADIKIVALDGGSFLPSQRLYNISVKELLALSKGLIKFRHFLLGRTFIIKVDNSSIFHMLKNPGHFIIEKTGPVSRILLQMQEYTFEPILVKTDDTSHFLADMISRGKYMKVDKVTAKDLLQPAELEEIARIQYFPIILSKNQLWQLIKKSYEIDTNQAQVQQKYKNFRGFSTLKTHSEIAGSIIVPPNMETKVLEITHICSAKRHVWFLKSKGIWMKNIAEKVAEMSLKCEKCQKFIINPINERFRSDRISGELPFQLISGDFSIINGLSKGVLVFQCANTKFTFAKLSSMKSESIATTIMTCLLRYGIAGATLKLDNQFKTTIIMQMAKLMQINIEFSTPRNSRSNSLAELAVKQVQKYLRLIAPDYENEEEVQFAIEIACLLINTEVKLGVGLTPLEIVYPHTSFTPFALDTIDYGKYPELTSYVEYTLDRLKGVYQIGDTGDQRKERDGQNQPLRVDDLVRVKLDNTERANKLCPLYSEHIYKIQTVNKVSNTYVITRVNTEAPGMRTKRFLYHRRRLKKILMPNEALKKFWIDFPNSSDPIELLKSAVKDGVFQEDTGQNRSESSTDMPEGTADNTMEPVNQKINTSESRGTTATAPEPVTDAEETFRNTVPNTQTRSLRERKVPNYRNLRKNH